MVSISRRLVPAPEKVTSSCKMSMLPKSSVTLRDNVPPFGSTVHIPLKIRAGLVPVFWKMTAATPTKSTIYPFAVIGGNVVGRSFKNSLTIVQ